MRKKYLLLSLFLFQTSSFIFADEPQSSILMPEPTPQNAVPVLEESLEEKRKDEKRKHIEETIDEKEEQLLDEKKQEEKKLNAPRIPQKKPKEEPHTELPKSFFQIGLTFPKATVSNGRKDFTCEPNPHLSFGTRLSSDPSKDPSAFVLGLRMAVFSGTGFLQNIPARFAYTYFSPVFGYQSLEPKEDGTLWMFLGGVSLISRRVDLDPSISPPGKDFETSNNVLWDGPGLWFEVFYGNLDSNTKSSVNYSVGVQKGVDKLFTWLGIYMSLWH